MSRFAIIRLPFLLAALAVGLLSLTADRGTAVAAEPRGLSFTFVDVEGGAATLIVTPAGESILIDSGNPGERDGARIVEAARKAGLTTIDHYITTHWHSDHFGGIATVAKSLPVGRIYGHRVPEPLPQDVNPDLLQAWRAVRPDPVFLEPGDRIDLRRQSGTPAISLRVLAADGIVMGERDGAPHVRDCSDGFAHAPQDTSDNARSLALLLEFGEFQYFGGGDLTWNVEHKLTCPKALVPNVDVYLSDHHGLDVSNHPALVRALAPHVAVVNNGARKGAETRTMTVLAEQVGMERVFQVHRNVRDGARNTTDAQIANDGESADCKGAAVALSVARDARSYVVDVPSRGTSRRFDVK
jgi:competence protein ComEC